MNKVMTGIPDAYQKRASREGKLELFTYETETGSKQACIYMPYGYEKSDRHKAYPFIYLMHGGRGDITTFLGTPEAPRKLKYAIDHLIEDRKLPSMILVCPSFYSSEVMENFHKQEDTPEYIKVRRAAAPFETAAFPDELRNYLIPAVEGVYQGDEHTEDLKMARLRRAFGGFSLGSVTTWHVFARCLDLVSDFMNFSGESWIVKEKGGAGSAKATAKALARAAADQGYGSHDFRIFSAVGSEDHALDSLEPQMKAMFEENPIFRQDTAEHRGNVRFEIAEGRRHDLKSAADYVYHGLLFLYGT